MKLFASILFAFVFLASAGQTFAYTSMGRTIGDTSYYNYSDGVTATNRNIGDTSYYNSSDGVTGTTRYIGDNGYYNYSSPSYGSVSVSSQRVGDSTYYSGAVTGSRRPIGSAG